MSTEELLEEGNLRYTSDEKPGFTRQLHGKHFAYYDLDGKRITDEAVIDRINKLVIPPAYEHVWICPYKNGYLQATGFDSKKRKQYRYHPQWIKISQEEKFSHMVDFAKSLPKIRKQVAKDLVLVGIPREKVLATVVWLLENTLIRIGNEEYEEENKSYGLTTMKNRHATIQHTDTIRFQFKGKSGVYHNIHIKSKRVAAIIRHCKELPGQDLFEYRDESGAVQSITSSHVNDYMQQISGVDITAKDFRTWGGTIIASSILDKCGSCEETAQSEKNVVETIKKVAHHLGNKPATCKKYYIHPAVISAYLKGDTLSNMNKKLKKKQYKKIGGLDECENKVLQLLQVYS